VNKQAFVLSAAFLIPLTGMRAVSSGTALFVSGQQRRGTRAIQSATANQPLPQPVEFREVHGRGLLVSTWINSVGPFTFAIDTGAGATIVSPRVAAEARIRVRGGSRPSISGLSGVVVSANDASINSLALGEPENFLPTRADIIVSGGLPRDLDGILDPNDAFGAFGYIIDLPRGELSAFDPREQSLSGRAEPRDGAIVPWLREGNSRRPFVMLDTGEKVLIDTGSSLGFAVRGLSATNQRQRSAAVHDVGGTVSARRVAPRTIAIGSLVLQNVPTDLVTGAAVDAPALLGLNALRPFRLQFDPLHRLIQIAPSESNYGRD
jgi:Aspartyl protease